MYHGHDDLTVVKRVQQLIEDAIRLRASDIHLEPMDGLLRVRYRLDGVLHDQPSIDGVHMLQVIARFKILGNLDSAEKRLPQDGKHTIMYHDEPIDLRIATFPSLYGEKVVVRILDARKQLLQLDMIGCSDLVYDGLTAIMQRATGFFLVTGPTGSGKTTTLYVMLATMNSTDKNIVTLEDPVEYSVAGITQGYINPAVGFTFEKGIRALLRQDPDILMVGEIRDRQTARVAVEAALTGHLVLSTLHTSDAPSAIMRLMDMGVEPFLINAALTGVLAQRLVRKLCDACKQFRVPNNQERILSERFSMPLLQVARPVGCSACTAGYSGRIGVFELLQMTDCLRALITESPSADMIRAQAIRDGMVPLLYDGFVKVTQGLTTVDELMRVLLVA